MWREASYNGALKLYKICTYKMKVQYWLYAGLDKLVKSSAFHAGDYGFESRTQYNAIVTQLVEYHTFNVRVPGSNPGGCT